MATHAHAAPAMLTVAPVGKSRMPIVVILLSLVTFGLYFLYWLYVNYQEQADHNGEGINGVTGVVLGIIFPPISWFLMPHTVAHTYDLGGQSRMCSMWTGLWVLVPSIVVATAVGASEQPAAAVGFGALIVTVCWCVWLFRVQDALNNYWESRI